MQIDDIKERYEKIYILADESTHKLIKTMKDDIEYLLNIAQTKIDEITNIQQMTAHNIIQGIVNHYNMGVEIDEETTNVATSQE